MARKHSRNTSSRNRNRKKGTSPAVKIIMIALGVVVVAGISWGIYKLAGPHDYSFTRSHLDQYVKQTEKIHLLDGGASVYVDMSDGMNSAYATPESKAILQAVINKLAGNDAIQFFGLADSKITQLELSHTQLYNYMLNPSSYDKQRAPIEQTLRQIIEKNQPAVMLTDFEEYKGAGVEKAAYAKESFIKWLANGNNITFYKWPFVENGKNKLMFIAVFDDNANRLNSLVGNAIRLTDPNIETFVLGSRDFAYPISTNYISIKDGGNYHDADGNDVVTNVIADGSAEGYYSYCQPFASSTGQTGQFAPLDTSVGSMAEYYPVGVSWTSALKNVRSMQEPGIDLKNSYQHFLSDLYVDFGAQDGYDIDNVEVRTYDMQDTMRAVAEGDSVFNKEPGEINLFLTADMKPCKDLPTGWKEIVVDFDEKFTGRFVGDIPSTNLIRANVVVAKVSANINGAIDFFSWPGNPSLSESIKETLTAASSNPAGRILYTYYLRSITE